MFETSWRRNDEASLLHPSETLLWCSNKTSWRRTTETSWRRSIRTSLGVSFETCLRRCGDVIVGRRCYVLLRRRYNVPIWRRRDAPLRRPGDVPLRRRWGFHLRRSCDVTGTYRETSLRRRHDFLMPSGSVLHQSIGIFRMVNLLAVSVHGHRIFSRLFLWFNEERNYWQSSYHRQCKRQCWLFF